MKHQRNNGCPFSLKTIETMVYVAEGGRFRIGFFKKEMVINVDKGSVRLKQ